MPSEIDRLNAELQSFLEERLSSGDYTEINGLVTGYAIWLERIRPENMSEDDSGYWWTAMFMQGATPTHKLGMAKALLQQAELPWEEQFWRTQDRDDPPDTSGL